MEENAKKLYLASTIPIDAFAQIFHKNVHYEKDLRFLLGKFIRAWPVQQVQEIYSMIAKKETDDKIIEYIRVNRPIGNAKVYDNVGRSDRAANIINKFLPADFRATNYLDVGCNQGHTSIKIGTMLGLNSSHIYGIDLENFGPQQIQPSQDFLYMKYDGINIPFENKSFDFVSSIMVLHHVEEIDELLTNINRVTQTNGYFLIKDHDVFSEYVDWLVYIEHMMYDVIDYGMTYDDFKKSYRQYTYNRAQLAQLIEKYGYKLIKTSDNRFSSQWLKYNPTQHYYALFKKI